MMTSLVPLIGRFCVNAQEAAFKAALEDINSQFTLAF